MISVAVQHHPSRAALLPPLLASLGDPVEVVTDPDPDAVDQRGKPLRSPWRTYRHVLEITPAWASHRLIVQDDIEPCPGFRMAAAAAIRARPDRLISFFVGGKPLEHANKVYDACDRDRAWADLGNRTWCPAVALAWPSTLIGEFLGFVERQRWHDEFRADDERIGLFLRATNRACCATVPSLVEHPDRVPSVVGLRAWAGQDKGRVAACMIPDECDATLIDWG